MIKSLLFDTIGRGIVSAFFNVGSVVEFVVRGGISKIIEN
jgi:hypothetical protein